jgi:hypothetical protein
MTDEDDKRLRDTLLAELERRKRLGCEDEDDLADEDEEWLTSGASDT